jgi:hypothetical protein
MHQQPLVRTVIASLTYGSKARHGKPVGPSSLAHPHVTVDEEGSQQRWSWHTRSFSQSFDASRSLTALEQDNTLIAVIEMTQSKWARGGDCSAAVLVTIKGKSLRDGLRDP